MTTAALHDLAAAADAGHEPLWQAVADAMREAGEWSEPRCREYVCRWPGQDWPRWLYAAWCEENAGEAECPQCHGSKAIRVVDEDAVRRNARTGCKPMIPPRKPKRCPTCSGSGRVPDGLADRAAFVRVQLELASNAWACQGCRRREISGNAVEYPYCFEGCEECDRHSELRRRERELWEYRRPDQYVNGYHWFTRPLGHVRRGFVEVVTCTAADWLAHADAIAWHKGQREKVCSGCNGRGGWEDPEEGQWVTCKCDRNRLARPCPPTANPITEVRLTTRPWTSDYRPMIGNEWGEILFSGTGTFKSNKWPGITFHLPDAR